MRRLFLLVLVSCTNPTPDDAVDSDTVPSVDSDSDAPSHTDADTDTPDSDRDTDDRTDDSDTAPPASTCSSADPIGTCPTGQVCAAGRCLFDIDPGDAPGDALQAWTDLVAWAEPRDLLADDHPETWATIDTDVRAALPSATTLLRAHDTMTRGLMRLRSGHTYLRSPHVCAHDPGFAAAQSDVGACVVLGDGDRLLVTDVEPGSPWQVGDELVALDGRSAADLIDDRIAQPQCSYPPATDASRRAEAAVSVLFRSGHRSLATVRRPDGTQVYFRTPAATPRVCTGRLGHPSEAAVAPGVDVAELADGVHLVRLWSLGDFQGGGGAEATVDGLRTYLTPRADDPIVIDIRGVRGGYGEVVDELLSWLLPPASVRSRCALRAGEAPDAVSDVQVSRTPDTPSLAITGPVALLVDARVYGAPEVLAYALAAHGRATLVGAPTHGSPGSSWASPWPALGAAVDGRRCEDATGLALEARPAPVDVASLARPSDLVAGVDTALEAARRAVLPVP